MQACDAYAQMIHNKVMMSCECVLVMQFDLNPVSGVARALYSYQAQSAEELSFQEGALIHLIHCRHGEVCAHQFRG